MADPHVYELKGSPVEDFHGRHLAVGVDYNCVTLGPGFTLDQGQMDHLLILLLTAAQKARACTFGGQGSDVVKWCGVCDSPEHTSDEHPKPPRREQEP